MRFQLRMAANDKKISVHERLRNNERTAKVISRKDKLASKDRVLHTREFGKSLEFGP